MVALQALHAWPLVPQAIAVVGVTQLVPEQHPLAQLVALQPSQAPLKQRSTPGQVPQLPPPAPQAAGVVPGKHVVPEQQPAHEVGSQTQWPPEQCWPGSHWAPVPQVHAPELEQPSARVVSQLMQVEPIVPQVAMLRFRQLAPLQQPLGQETTSHTQVPPLQRWPGTHWSPDPQPQVPLAAQWSA